MSKKLIIFIFLFVLLAGLFLTGHLVLAAAPCNPGVSTAVCNPLPSFFIDWGTDNTFTGIVKKFIGLILPVAGLIAVLFVIIGGFQYVMSGADEEMAEKGKKTLKNAIIGVVIIVLSWVIVTVVSNALTKR